MNSNPIFFETRTSQMPSWHVYASPTEQRKKRPKTLACPGGLYSTKFQIVFSLLQAEIDRSIDRYLNNQRYYYRQTLRVS